MKIDCPLSAVAIGLTVLTVGCQSIDSSIFGGSFGRNSSAMVGGGAVAGQDYVIGLKPSEAAQQYFASASASDAKAVTVTPGDDKGTGVTWTDDGGIVIPPGTTIEFTNKGCCLDPHLPAPKADEEMQFIKTSCLIPTELQGTYKNLLRRAAAGDEDVKSNLQHLMWTLRTAGSNDAYAKNLTDRQREILAECAEAGSFDGYCQDLHRYDWLKKLVKDQVSQVAEQLQIEVGNVTYKASDLLDPEIGKQKVSAHLGELIHMNEYLPVVHSGFNYGELEKGVYTDIKGNGTLSFKAKVANSTSEPFVFYPMDYVAQVGSGQNMQGAFFAAADSSMKQRTTTGEQDEVEAEKKCDHNWRVINNETGSIIGEDPQSWKDNRKKLREQYKEQMDELRNTLADEIIHMDRNNDLEYGTLIYIDVNNEIRHTPITKGNYDWTIVDTDDKTILQRTTLRNGKYYVYDGNRIGREVNSKWGDYELHWSISWLSGRTCVPQKSWEVPSVPPGAIPLEIVHLHPEYSTFSPEDLLQADEQGVAITVVNEGNWWRDNRWIKYEPDDESFQSSLGDGEVRRLNPVHDELKRMRKQKYTYKCTKCGATR